jgi:hypothetical protein
MGEGTVKRRTRVAVGPLAVALALIVALGLAACGSSTNKTTSSSTPAPATTQASNTSGAATGSPVKIGLIASSTGVTAQPTIYQAAEVGAAAANASGGLLGHKIEIDFCDNQSSLQTAAVCAQKLIVQDHDTILAGDDASWETTVMPVVDAHHVLWWNGEGASLPIYTDPNVYFTEPAFASFDEIPSLLPPNQKVGYFVADIAVAKKDAELSAPLYQAQGDKVTVIPVPLAANSFSAPCLAAKNAGDTYALASFNAEAQFAPMAEACSQLGVKMVWALEGSVVGPAVFKSMQTVGLNGVIVLPLSPKGIASELADAKTYGPSIENPYDDAAQMAYMAYKTLPIIVKGANSLDPATIEAWLSKQTALNLDGFVEPMNYTTGYTPMGKTLPRVKNTCVYKYSEANGKVTPTRAAPYCYKPASS